MVPIASKGVAKRFVTLEDEATAAMATAPRPLTAVCSKMEPMAVMEYCRPMGRPIISSLLT